MSALKGVPPEKKFPRDTQQDGTVKDSKAKAPPLDAKGGGTHTGLTKKALPKISRHQVRNLRASHLNRAGTNNN